MDIEISGLDDLRNELAELQEAATLLEGDIATITFDPDDPQSVEQAIHKMEQAVDAKLAPYRNNPMVEVVAEQVKAHYREAIIDPEQEKE